ALARRAGTRRRAVPRGLGGARARPAQPLARQARLLPAAALSRDLAADRPVPRRRRVAAARPRLGARAARAARRRARAAGAASAAAAGRVDAIRLRARDDARRVRRRRARAPGRGRAPAPACRAVVARRRRRGLVARRRDALPAGVRGRPNRAMVEDVARELRFRPDLRMAFCSDPTRVRRDVLLEVRINAIAECDLWSLAGSREPFLLLATPAQDASFRVDRRYRHIATYRYLPADTLTLQGLFT